MPTYEYTCGNGHAFERYLPVAMFNEPQTCGCGAIGTKQISAPIIFRGQEICYDSPIDGRPITSMRARIEDLKRNGCQPYDPEMKTDYLRRNARQESELEKSVDETVDREIALMPAVKRERLQAEMEHGFTAEPVRVTPPAKPVKVEVKHG